jgi:pimeloyl-ACP methyl ester carboxylesterase
LLLGPGTMMLLRLFSLANALLFRLLGARRSHLRVGPVRLAYYQLGPEDGEPWLLLHGLGAVAATWIPVVRAFRREHRMIVPELSALGGSHCPGGGLAVKPAAKVLARLLEKELGGRPAVVAGISLGGWMAVRLALERPDLVSRLVLIDAGGYRDQDWDTIQRLVTVEDLDGVDRLYPALFNRVPWLMRVSRQGFLLAYTSPAVKGILAELSEGDTFDAADLERLRVPTTLIWGELDGLFTVETARAMAEALPHAHLEVLPDCGHAVHMECPDLLVQALRRARIRLRESTPEEPWPARTT